MAENPAVSSETYRYFDLTVSVNSDSPRFASFFEDLYRPFRAPDAESTVLTFDVSASEGTLALDGEALLKAELTLLFPTACERILDVVAAHTTGHIMVHAGAVSWDGAAIVIPGYSHHGKTTLILELVRRGFGFLSDEIAALNRSTGLIDPFPRRPRVWPRTLALLGLTGRGGRAGNLAPGPGGKVVLDVDLLRPGATGVSCPPAHIVTLWNPANDANPIDEPERTWYVVLDRLPVGLVGGVRSVENVVSVEAVIDGVGEAVLQVVILRGEARAALDAVAELSRRAGATVLDEVKGGQWAPDFGTPPVLEEMSAVEAAVELVRHFRGGADSRLLKGPHAPGPARLFVELADLASHLTCYRLRVGRLEAMADLICGLVADRRAG